jgi:hypothetical protein
MVLDLCNLIAIASLQTHRVFPEKRENSAKSAIHNLRETPKFGRFTRKPAVPLRASVETRNVEPPTYVPGNSDCST